MLMQNHRIENAERIVGFPFVLLGEYGGTVFVADEQFIVGRQKCNAVLLHFAISITLVQEIFRTVYHFYGQRRGYLFHSYAAFFHR